LHLDATGQLVTQQGYAVLGEGGPLQLDLGTPHTISISPDGQVSQGVEARGRLRAVEFEDPKRLTRIGQGLFLAQDPTARPSDATQTRFHQGALEAANTVAATEMASLLTALRLYEANQRVIQTQDDRMGKAIAELGQPA
jgi:flagellar basal body rod protein FlgG